MSSYFFGALLGENVDPALHQFLRKAESLDPDSSIGTIAIETYADLLARIGRYSGGFVVLDQAHAAGNASDYGIAPSLLELSSHANDYRTDDGTIEVARTMSSASPLHCCSRNQAEQDGFFAGTQLNIPQEFEPAISANRTDCCEQLRVQSQNLLDK